MSAAATQNDKKRVALVTGGAGGIGRAITKRLAADGYWVVIHYNNSSVAAHALQKSLSAGTNAHLVLRADISLEKDTQELLERIREKYGRLDVIVHNAGRNQMQSLVDMKVNDIRHLMDVNVHGAISLTQQALPLLKASTDPRLVFIVSTNPFRGSTGKNGYPASKSTLIGVVRSLAVELAPSILVNGIAPGYIQTGMLRRFQRESPSVRQKSIPLRRIGTPDDVASAVSFLCSSDSSYITGQCLHVNGGVYFA